MKDAKDIAVAILGKPKGDSEGDDDEGEAKMPPLEDVMGDFLSASKSGDMKAMAKSFHAAHEVCMRMMDHGDDDTDE